MNVVLTGLDTAAWSLGALACLLAAAWLQRCRLRFGTARAALVLALGTTGLWALTGAASGIDTPVESLAESLRNLAWIFALYRLFEVDGRHALVKPVRPLLAALAAWQGSTAPLQALVDGWEAMLDPDAPDLHALAEARAALGQGLAEQAGQAEMAESAGAALRGWSLVVTGAQQDLPPLSMPRELRALAVLHGLARRRGGQMPLLDGPLALAAAMRIGMIGR